MKIISFHAEGAGVTGYLQDDYDTLVAHRVRPARAGSCPTGIRKKNRLIFSTR